MQTDQLVFLKSVVIFQKIIDKFEKSRRYHIIGKRLRDLLILGDRVLVACKEDPDFHKLNRFINKLLELSEVNDIEAVEELLLKTEMWLKTIYFFVFPDRWKKLMGQKDLHFNLYQCIQELRMLDDAELKLSSELKYAKQTEEMIRIVSSIEDEIVRSMVVGIYLRNDSTHNTANIPQAFSEMLLTATLAMIITPLSIHYDLISQRLRGLVTKKFSDEKTRKILNKMAGKVKEHLNYFRVNDQQVDEIKDIFCNQTDEYLLLVGEQGKGKSILCSALSEKFSDQIEVFGSNSIVVQETAPWLPAIILHDCSGSYHPAYIIKSIIAQANTLVVQDLVSPQFYNQLDKKSFHPLKIYQTLSSSSSSIKSEINIAEAKNKVLNELKEILQKALVQVIEERGEVIVIIDAIDRISPDGSSLSFLPDTLPKGAKILLTTRPEAGVIQWLKKNRKVKEIDLKEKFIFDQGMIQEKEEWLENNVLKEILIFLAISEPITKVNLTVLQYYLETKGIKFNIKGDLKPQLVQLKDELIGLDTERIKLRFQQRAKEILSKNCSPRDLRRKVEEIVDWIIKDAPELPLETIADYLYYFYMSREYRIFAFQMIEGFKHIDNKESLEEMGKGMKRGLMMELEKKDIPLSTEIAEYLWENRGFQSSEPAKLYSLLIDLGYKP